MRQMLLTAFPQQEAGVVILRPGRECMSNFHARQRLLITAAPAEFDSLPLGELPTSLQELAADPRLLPIFEQPRVLVAAGKFGSLESWVEKKTACQWSPGSDSRKYHHHSLVTKRIGSSAVRLCWACDNLHATQHHPALAEIAAANRAEWVIEMVRTALRFPVWHQVTLPEFCWWTVMQGVADLLPAGVAYAVTGITTERITGTMKESDTQPTADPLEIVAELVEQVKPVIKLAGDDAPPAGFMLRPKLQRWESEKYTRWVKTQACCGCGKPADDPHHIINTGLALGGVGTKTHDLFVIPVCRRCHDDLHADVLGWEREHGSQLALLVQFLDRALGIGAIFTA